MSALLYVLRCGESADEEGDSFAIPPAPTFTRVQPCTPPFLHRSLSSMERDPLDPIACDRKALIHHLAARRRYRCAPGIASTLLSFHPWISTMVLCRGGRHGLRNLHSYAWRHIPVLRLNVELFVSPSSSSSYAVPTLTICPLYTT